MSKGIRSAMKTWHILTKGLWNAMTCVPGDVNRTLGTGSMVYRQWAERNRAALTEDFDELPTITGPQRLAIREQLLLFYLLPSAMLSASNLEIFLHFVLRKGASLTDTKEDDDLPLVVRGKVFTCGKQDLLFAETQPGWTTEEFSRVVICLSITSVIHG